ncbi:MAG: hypothetical protein NVSMB29_17310 [Candidatus Dormibacteria bacterium]
MGLLDAQGEGAQQWGRLQRLHQAALDKHRDVHGTNPTARGAERRTPTWYGIAEGPYTRVVPISRANQMATTQGPRR